MNRLSLALAALTCTLFVADSALSQAWPNRGDNGSTQGCDGSCSDATCLEKSQARWDLHRQHGDLITERNDAWPKPFQCYDRQAYHSVFAVMTQRGWQCECTLTSDHFDAKTQELNQAGKAKIYGIMNNLPEIARQIYVFQDSTPGLAETRMTAIRKEIETAYPSLAAPPVALTQYVPHGMNGSLVEDVQKKFVEGLPEPKVPRAKTTTISNQ
jgi:hypothetical protein